MGVGSKSCTSYLTIPLCLCFLFCKVKRLIIIATSYEDCVLLYTKPLEQCWILSNDYFYILNTFYIQEFLLSARNYKNVPGMAPPEIVKYHPKHKRQVNFQAFTHSLLSIKIKECVFSYSSSFQQCMECAHTLHSYSSHKTQMNEVPKCLQEQTAC
jgi:hypothetical protein